MLVGISDTPRTSEASCRVRLWLSPNLELALRTGGCEGPSLGTPICSYHSSLIGLNVSCDHSSRFR